MFQHDTIARSFLSPSVNVLLMRRRSQFDRCLPMCCPTGIGKHSSQDLCGVAHRKSRVSPQPGKFAGCVVSSSAAVRGTIWDATAETASHEAMWSEAAALSDVVEDVSLLSKQRWPKQCMVTRRERLKVIRIHCSCSPKLVS